MRTVSLAVAGVIVVALSNQAAAQFDVAIPPPPPVFPKPIAAPTSPLPTTLPDSAGSAASPARTAEPSVIPGGIDVSKPLQPSLDESLPSLNPAPGDRDKSTLTIVDERSTRAGKILGDAWGSSDLMFWWPKTAPVPPLVTGSRAGVPILGQSQTTLLIGNQSIESQPTAGYRVTSGWSLNAEETIGFEGSYFFLGSRTLSSSASNLGGQYSVLGLPYLNATTGQQDALTVASPGQTHALITVSASARLQGAEANFVGNLFADQGIKLHALAGYRFFQLNEGLRIEQTWLQSPTAASNNLQTLGMIADQFDAHNEFHGGQLGLMADLQRGMFFVEMTGKAALGANNQVVTISGATHLITSANPIPLLQSFPGGVYSAPSNMGRTSHAALAFLPEGTFKFGLKFSDNDRIFVGYNFLYLNNVVRPGDQIDRTLNPSQIALLSRGGAVVGADRPQTEVNRTDYWVQGLIIGFESRF